MNCRRQGWALFAAVAIGACWPAAGIAQEPTPGQVSDPSPGDLLRAKDPDGALARVRVLADGDAARAGALMLPDAGLWMPVADHWLRTGRNDDGTWVFERLTGASGRQPWALGNLALVRRHMGDLTGGRAAYQEALSKAPLDPILWNDYGLLLLGAGDHEGARDAFAQSLLVDEDPAIGPGLTNQVRMSLLRPRIQPEPRWDLLREGLRRRPDGAMLRRVSLDLLLSGRTPGKGTRPR